MTKTIAAILMFAATAVFAEDVAVFPAQGVNTDKSYVDAFGMVLAQKYAKVSGLKVLSPLKSAKSLDADSNHARAAARLGVSEYLEIEAVGLYISKKEEKEVVFDSVKGTNVYVNVKSDGDHNGDDQDKLDNHKTIVNVSRMDKNGNEIYKVDMTLVTYGDIEEGSDRIAEALWRKVPIEQTMNMANVTRREGMGNNQAYSEKRKGIRIGGMFPYSWESGVPVSSIVTIGFDMRFDAQKYFLEVGGGGKIPTSMYDSKSNSYGGGYFDLGGSYYIVPGNVSWYVGGGVMPGILTNVNSSPGPSVSFGLVPHIQTGIMLPRTSRTAFYAELWLGQNVMPINGEYTTDSTDAYGYTTQVSHSVVMRPLEVAVNFGICW